MEARMACAAVIAASLLSLGASYRTQNFIVSAPTPQFAKQVGDAAESMRRELAIEWLGHELPRWKDPCPITVQVGPTMGAGGVTSFMFDRRRPFGWQMSVQGSAERILDSVLPHEITHTIFATHFGRPLPRWADEGACTTVEHVSEKRKQQQMLVQFLTSGRGIAFNQMFAMREYPSDIMPLYSQGYSLARFLIEQGGKKKFVAYVGDGMDWNNWTAATKQHYGYESLSVLQVEWLEWVRQGCPTIEPKDRLVAAQAEAGTPVAPASYNRSETDRMASAVQRSDQVAKSWYARVRDGDSVDQLVVGERASQVAPPPASGDRGAAQRPESGEAEPPGTRSASRTPVDATGDVLIEWTRPIPHAAGSTSLPSYEPPPPPRPAVGSSGPSGAGR